MKNEFFKRAFALLAAAVLIFVFGCAKDADTPKAANPPAEETAASSASDAAFAGYTGVYHVDGTNETVENGTYAASDTNENALFLENGGKLALTGANVNKLGDASGDPSDGRNAAIVAVKGGALTMTGGSVTTNGLGAYGVFVSGGDASFVADGAYVSTSGASSAGIFAANGAAVVFSNGTIATEGSDAPCIILLGGGVTLTSVKLSAKSGAVVSAPNGDSRLMLEGTALAAAPVIGSEATLWIELKNSASLFGTFGESLPARASVSLDASSTWTLDADAYVSIFLNADAAQQNIVSNGHSIFYDSNAEQNAPLGGNTYALPGGGYLTPLI